MIYQSDSLSVQRLEGGIAELNFDRQGESVNKFDRQTVASLTAALDALAAESGIRGLLVTSGKPVFIVGADITEFTSLFGAAKEDIKPFTGTNNANFNRLQNLPYPSCAAINGAAMGGGLEICLACDFRVMSTAASIGLPETKLGILPGWGGTVRLPRLIGQGRALDLILTGRPVGAKEAQAIGLVNRVVPTGAARAVAEALAEEIASFPQACLRADRRSARDQWSLGESAALREEFARGRAVLASGESAAGAARFVGGAGRGGLPA